MRRFKLRDELPYGLTKYEFLKLSKTVLARDGRKCVLCWARSNVCVHHFWDNPGQPIFPPNVGSVRTPYVRTESFDLVTLCSVCHGKVHSSDWNSPFMNLLRSVVQLINSKNTQREAEKMKERKQPVEEREGTVAGGNVIFYDAEGKPFVVENSKNKEVD